MLRHNTLCTFNIFFCALFEFSSLYFFITSVYAFFQSPFLFPAVLYSVSFLLSWAHTHPLAFFLILLLVLQFHLSANFCSLLTRKRFVASLVGSRWYVCCFDPQLLAIPWAPFLSPNPFRAHLHPLEIHAQLRIGQVNRINHSQRPCCSPEILVEVLHAELLESFVRFH